MLECENFMTKAPTFPWYYELRRRIIIQSKFFFRGVGNDVVLNSINGSFLENRLVFQVIIIIVINLAYA